MQLEKILAPTMAEALQQVKRLLGPDAVILSTRTILTRRWLGLRKRESVEVMAGRGMNCHVAPQGPGRAGRPGDETGARGSASRDQRIQHTEEDGLAAVHRSSHRRACQRRVQVTRR